MRVLLIQVSVKTVVCGTFTHRGAPFQNLLRSFQVLKREHLQVFARLECPLQEDRKEDLRTRFSNFADEVQAMKALGASVAGSYCEICPYVGLSKEEAAEVRIRSVRQETELMRARAARLLAEKELSDALKEAGLPIE